MMTSLIRSIGLLSLIAINATATLAQAPALTINVVGLNGQTRPRVTIKCKEGCPATTSDANGTAILKLVPENVSSGLVELQVVNRGKEGWVLISPYEGQWPIAKRSLTVMVARRGDVAILSNNEAVMAVTARVLKAMKPKSGGGITDEGRRRVLKEQAEAVGLTPEEVDQAIREWGKKAQDPFQKGLAALYERNFPRAEEFLNHSYELRKEAANKAVAEFADTAFFLGQSLYEQGKYSAAAEMFQEVYALKKQGPDVLSWLGVSLMYMGRYREAEPLLKRALELDEQSSSLEPADIVSSLNNLAAIYMAERQHERVEPLLKRALDISEKIFGKEHNTTAQCLNNLAELYQVQRRYSDAELLYKRAIEINEKVLGKEHLFTLSSLSNLAFLYSRSGKYREAEPLLHQVLKAHEKVLGPEHPSTAGSLTALALFYRWQGRYTEAEPLYRRALDINERALGKEHPATGASVNNLAVLYCLQERYAEAEPLLKRALAIFERVQGEEHVDVAMILHSLSLLLQRTGREEEAAKLEERAKAIREKAKLKGQNWTR